MHASTRQDRLMTRIVSRAQRPHNAPTVLLQARVAPEARSAVQEAAQRSGVSIAYYMEKLILQLDQAGELPLVPRPSRESANELANLQEASTAAA